MKGGNEWAQCPMVEQLPGRDEDLMLRNLILCCAGWVTRVWRASTNHVEVSMVPSRNLSRAASSEGRPENKSPK